MQNKLDKGKKLRDEKKENKKKEKDEEEYLKYIANGYEIRERKW